MTSEKPDWADCIAAQLWCEERFSHKEMDVAFATAIADALREARNKALDEAAAAIDNVDPALADVILALKSPAKEPSP